MKTRTTRFGEIEVPDEEIVSFPDGLLGFSDLRRYVLIPNPKGGPFLWLQSLEEPSVAFVLADPLEFFADYVVKVRAEELAALKLGDVSEGRVRVILTVTSDPREITANLQGPLVFNPKDRLGRQLVLSEPGISTRHKLLVSAT